MKLSDIMSTGAVLEPSSNKPGGRVGAAILKSMGAEETLPDIGTNVSFTVIDEFPLESANNQSPASQAVIPTQQN